MPGSLVTRLLRASLILPQGNFPGTNSNTLVLENFRMRAQLAGSANYPNTLTLNVYGMRQVDMQALTVVFFANTSADVVSTDVSARALIKLEANNGSGWLQVFEGQFQEGQANYEELPDVSMHVIAATGYGEQLLAASPTSIKGAANVATLAAKLASQMGFGFENNGVTGVINNPYFAGTLMNQFRQLTEAARIDYYFDAKATLIICPKNQPRQGHSPVVLSSTSGLVGYPTLQRFGLHVKCLFDPAIELGSAIQIDNTPVHGANGLWFPMSVTHSLDSLMPGGQWFSELDCYPHAAIAEQEQ